MSGDGRYEAEEVLREHPDLLREAEQLREEQEKSDPAGEGAAILEDLVEFICRFVVISDAQATVLALWTVHTHCFAACDATAYAWIHSPEKRSGKTRLLEVEELVVTKPWLTGKVTPACLVRKIDALQPTLLLDETDTALASSEEYREAVTGVLNMGHRRGGKTSCCVGKGADITFKDFHAFCPKMIAGLRSLPDTVKDRAIPIRIQRKTRDAKIERFRRSRVEPEASKLRARIAAWSKAQIASLRKSDPELPHELTDRMQDGAEPLLAIAELVGHGWPEKARKALVRLCCTGSAAEDDSVGVLLLTDIAKIFLEAGDGKTLKLASEHIAKQLAEMEDRPWSEWGRQQKPITKKGLASQLGKYEIRPRLLNLGGDDRARGYYRRDFIDAWCRYCTTVNPELIKAASLDPDPDEKPDGGEETVQDDLFGDADVTDKRPENPSVTEPLRVSTNVYAGRNGVTDKKGGTSTGERKKVEL